MAIQDLWIGEDGTHTTRHGTGRRWRVVWRDTARRQRTRSFARRPDADRFDKHIQGELTRGTYIDPSAGNVALDAYAATWMANRHVGAHTASRNRRELRLHILPTFGHRPMATILPSEIQGWLGKTGLAPRSKKILLTTLSQIFRAAVDDQLLVRNPCTTRGVKAPKPAEEKIIPWTPEKVTAVIAAMPEHYRAAALLAAYAGLRTGEVRGLSAADIDRAAGVIHINRQVLDASPRVFAPPKGGRARTVPLPRSLAAALAAHELRFGARPVTLAWATPGGKPQTHRLLFHTATARPITRSSLAAAFIRAITRAGYTYEPGSNEGGLHVLRHYYASALIHGGVNIKAVSEHLGHTDAAITLRVYTHVMAEAADQSRQVLEAAFAAAHTHDHVLVVYPGGEPGA